MLYAGSLVFAPPAAPGRSAKLGEWWTFLKGADWRHPYGPKSNIDNLDHHPVVHVSFADALAYARWAGKDLPTEADGNSPRAAGSTVPNCLGRRIHARRQARWPIPGNANFQRQSLTDDGFERTSPVTAFAPNGYGVHDMIGNVWESTTDWYTQSTSRRAEGLLIPENPRGGAEAASYDPCQPNIEFPAR